MQNVKTNLSDVSSVFHTIYAVYVPNNGKKNNVPNWSNFLH